MENHHHLYPIGHVLASNEDTDSCFCLLESSLSLCVKMFRNEPNVRHALSDDSGSTFKVFEAVFPLAFLMKCFANEINRNFVKHACRLNDE